MKILFIHVNFPGQYKHLAAALGQDPGHEIAFITTNGDAPKIPGVHRYTLDIVMPNPALSQAVSYLRQYETQIHRGEGFYQGFQQLKQKGFYPDVIVMHPGWGAGLFVKDAFPDVPVLTYQEIFRHPEWDFVDSEPPRRYSAEESKFWRVHSSRNLNYLVWTDWSISPTVWQRNGFPEAFHPRISVLHEGVDCAALDPAKISVLPLILPDGRKIPATAELVTFVARAHEPTRGFLTVMRAIAKIQQQRPQCHFLLLGTEQVNYSNPPPGGGSWRAQMLAELDLDLTYIHMPGNMDYRFYLGLLRASNVHYYFTTGFVLSWSCLEAMALGCLVIGSATPPVQEVIRHGYNGLLVDFNDPDALAEQTLLVLRDPEAMQPLRAAARHTIETQYNVQDVVPLQQQLVLDLAARRIPPPAAQAIIDWRNARGLKP